MDFRKVNFLLLLSKFYWLYKIKVGFLLDYFKCLCSELLKVYGYVVKYMLMLK